LLKPVAHAGFAIFKFKKIKEMNYFMSYVTDFSGEFYPDKNLDRETVDLINNLAMFRREARDIRKIAELKMISEEEALKRYGIEGEFYFDKESQTVLRESEGIRPPKTQPGYYSCWYASKNGEYISAAEGMNNYNAEKWLCYIIVKILKPRGYILNGKADAYGEEPDDRWALVVMNNTVYTYSYTLVPNPKTVNRIDFNEGKYIKRKIYKKQE
jgi:hypothetical protein